MYGWTRLALDRPRPDERDLDRQVVEVLRPRAQQHLHLRAALDLEDADRVRVADLAVDLLVVERDPRQVDRARRARARSGRRSPRPRTASRARAGRSSGSRRRRRSPCPTGRSGGRPSPPASPGTSSISGRDEMIIPPGCCEMWRGQAGDLAASSPKARQRGEPRLVRQARDEGELLGDAARVPAVGDAGEPLELAEREAERLADVADRAARAVGGEAGDESGVLAAVVLGDARRSASRGCRAGSRGRCPGPPAISRLRKRPSERSGLDRVDVREAGQVADDRADRAAAAAAGRQRRCAASRGPRTSTRDLARELEHLPVEEEEAGEAELGDQARALRRGALAPLRLWPLAPP